MSKSFNKKLFALIDLTQAHFFSKNPAFFTYFCKDLANTLKSEKIFIATQHDKDDNRYQIQGIYPEKTDPPFIQLQLNRKLEKLIYKNNNAFFLKTNTHKKALKNILDWSEKAPYILIIPFFINNQLIAFAACSHHEVEPKLSSYNTFSIINACCSHLIHEASHNLKEKNIEQELSNSNSFMTSLLDNLHSGILVEDEDNTVIQANQLFCDMFEITDTPSELAGNQTEVIYNHIKHVLNQPERFMDGIDRCLAWREVVASEEIRLKDGRQLERDYIPVFVEDQQGNAAYRGHLWSYRDITGRKRIETEIQSQSQRLKQIATEERALSALLSRSLETTSIPVFLERTLNALYKETEWLHLEDQSAAYLPSNNDKSETYQIVASLDHAKICTLDQGNDIFNQENLIEWGSIECIEPVNRVSYISHGGDNTDRTCYYRIYFIDGKKILGKMELHVSRFHQQSNREIAFLNRVADIVSIGISRRCAEASQIRAKEKALSASNAKSQFLAVMSHEIRTPMNGVLGMAQLLHHTQLDSDQKKLVETLEESGRILLTIINDILDFSKIEAGRLDLDPVDMDLEETIYEVTKLFVNEAKKKNLELAVNYPAICPRNVRSDVVRLRQVLINLIGNAIKFTEAGHIYIDVSPTDVNEHNATLTIKIQDTGIGISEEAQKHLFQSFSQADASTTRRFGGTGLGLAICKRLIEKMKGCIQLHSTAGEGTTFEISIPFPFPESKSRPESNVLQNTRVLLINNDSIFCSSTEEQLWSLGVTVRAANNFRETVSILEETYNTVLSFDAIVVFDEGNENEVNTELRTALGTKFQHIPTLLISSFLANSLKTEKNSINTVLTRPVSSHDLNQALSKLLTGQTNRRDNVKNKNGEHAFSGNILVAEDVEINRQVIKAFLTRLGVQTTFATTGVEAIEKWRQEKFDIILMDCLMPEMDGYEATNIIRQEEADNEHTPVIAVTANALSEEQEKCQQVGMDDYLSKPITQASLSQMLQRWLPSTPHSESTIVTPEDKIISPTPLKQSKHIDSFPVLNRQKLKSLKALLGENYPPLLEKFLSDSSDKVKELEDAFMCRDIDTLYKTSHALKGIAANVGAQRMYEIADQIQAIVCQAPFERTENLIKQLSTCHEATQTELKCELTSGLTSTH